MAPSHPPGTARHLPALLGSRAPGPRNLRSPGSRSRSRPARSPLPGDGGQHRSLGAAGPALLSSAARGGPPALLGMLRCSHANSAEEEKQGESPALAMRLGQAKTYSPRGKEPVSERKGGKKRWVEAGGKKTSGQ